MQQCMRAADSSAKSQMGIDRIDGDFKVSGNSSEAGERGARIVVSLGAGSIATS